MRKSKLYKVLSIFTFTGVLLGTIVMPVMAAPATIIFQNAASQYVQANYLNALSYAPMRTSLTTALTSNELANMPIFVIDDSGKVIDYLAAINKNENYATALTDPTVNDAVAPVATQWLSPPLAMEPLIYLYPTTEQQISVKLVYNGKFTCTYPEYKNGWEVIAHLDGTLLNSGDNKEYSYLFWEGILDNNSWDMTKGFVVAGKDTKDFLQDKLSLMGLTPKEYNDFIVFWLPKMQDNPYNLITFANEEYEQKVQLSIDPKPDSVLRVFMVYKPITEKIDIPPQQLTTFDRTGFSVVEWGGTAI